jgi:transposase
MALREELLMLWNYTPADAQRECRPVLQLAAEHLRKWCAWAQRSRLASFVKLSRTLREHAEGILGYYQDKTTSAAVEAINGLTQQARRRARGYRNFANFCAISYWTAGLLEINTTLPAEPTHSI